jgi:diguanylate cyclase (GGDEF)-like protein/PAS domain S-box-containing protein
MTARESRQTIDLGTTTAYLLQALTLSIGASPDFETALEVVLQQVCLLTDWAFAEAWIPDAEAGVLTCSPIWHSSRTSQALLHFREVSETLTFPPGVGLPGRVWSSQQPEWASDVSQEPETAFSRVELAIAAGLRSGLGIPVVADGRVLAVLVFFMQDSRQEDWQLVKLVWAIAAPLGMLMQLKQTEKHLQEKEEFLRLLLDNSLPRIFWKDRNSVYQGCNRKWAEARGFSDSEEVVGLTDFDLPHLAEAAASYIEQDRQVMETGIPMLHLVESEIGLDGQQIWQEVSKIPIRNAAGEVIGLLGTIEDITERCRVEEALKQAEQKYRSIFENAVEGIFQSSIDGKYLTVNPMLARLYGYDSVEQLTNSLSDIQHQLYVDPNRRTEFIRLLQEQDVVRGFESEVYQRDGNKIWILENARAIRDAEGQLLGCEGTVEDITDRKRAEAALHRRDSLLQGVADATHYLLTNSDCEQAIAQAIAALGTAAHVDRVYIFENHPHPQTGEISMSTRFEWTRPEIPPILHQSRWQNLPYISSGLGRWYRTLASGQSIPGIVRLLPKAEQKLLNQEKILSMLMVPIFVEEEFWGYIGLDDCHSEREWSKNEESILMAIAASIGVVLQRRWTEDMIRYQAFHDLLTGLPNRILFGDRLLQALTQAQLHQSMIAVMFLDLDRFKTINDTLGHAIGDQLLQNSAQRLISCIRESDIVARWGGDEFTLLLPQVTCAEDAAQIAQRILEVMQPAFNLEGYELHITSSIGIALSPQDGTDAQSLLKNADAALYRAKDQGRNNYQFYNAAISSEVSELLILDNSLHHALERQEFVIYYQPQINVHTGQVTQMEALLRWQHPDLGIIPPQKFISLAEENGLIIPIGEWVLQRACAQCKAWQAMNLSPVRIAVNLSVRQFQQPQLIEKIMQVLQTTELDPALLELEITETAAMRNIDFSIGMLHELRAKGVRISMDDFGTGYSSLSYLKKFPLDTLKIDRSFIQDLTDNSEDVAIITAIITLGQGLKLSVVAEGVETENQMSCLRSLHCQEMQGYWFSPPLDAQAATQFLQAHPHAL